EIGSSKDTRLLNRCEFNGLCVVLSSFVTSSGASALDATGAESTGTRRTVRFRDGTVVPALGQGSAGLGKGRRPLADEEEALRTGLSLGMTLIDTSGDYGGGRSEELIKRVIAGPTSSGAAPGRTATSRASTPASAMSCSTARFSTLYARPRSSSRVGDATTTRPGPTPQSDTSHQHQRVFMPAFAAWPAALRRPAPPATLAQPPTLN